MSGKRYALLLLIALALRLVWYALHADTGYSAFDQGDYRLYEIGAEHFAEHGDFSNSLFLARPPAYPLLIYLVGGAKEAVLLANCLLGALMAPLAASVARALGLRPQLALWVGGLVCIEPTSVIHGSVTLNSEPLANATFLAFLLCALRGTQAGSGNRQSAWFISAALLLAISALTRPTAHWLWPVMGVLLWWQFPRLRRKVALFMLVSMLPLSAWVAHNGLALGNFTFSTVGVYTALYYRAASVERVATDQPIEEVFAAINRRVAARIGQPDESIGAEKRHEWLAANARLSDAMLAEALAIFRRYPLSYALTLPVGLLRIYGIFSSYPQLGQPLLSLAWLWNLCLAAGWCVGIWRARAERHAMLRWQLTLVGYITVTTVLVSSASNSARMTSMITPLLIAALVYVVDEWLRRSGRLSRHFALE